MKSSTNSVTCLCEGDIVFMCSPLRPGRPQTERPGQRRQCSRTTPVALSDMIVASTFNRRLRMFRQHATYIPNDFRRVQVRRVPWRTSALVSQWVHAELEDRPSCGKVHRARMDQRHDCWIFNGNVSELGDAGRACHGWKLFHAVSAERTRTAQGLHPLRGTT